MTDGLLEKADGRFSHQQVVAMIAYGLLAPQLGFYWDDLPMSWIRYELGAEAMTRYCSTNRPVWGLLYQVTTRLIPQEPVYWQAFALLWRWLGAVVVWAIARQLWKDKPRFALSAAYLFLIYPGFNQQWGSYLYSHFFIVIFFYLYSVYLSLRRKTIPALIFSALNLWMMEYFFPLEFARIGFIWTSLRDEYPNPRERIKPSLKLWTPYLILFFLPVLSRLFIFNNQVYGIGLGAKLKTAPLATLLSLAQDIFISLWTVLVAAWIQIVNAVDPSVHGTLTIALYLIVALIVFAIALYFLMIQTKDGTGRRDTYYAIGLGLFLLPFAGAPFWLTGLTISLAHAASRFTLPFMLAVSLILAGLIEFIPVRARYFLLAAIIGFSAGRQFLWSTDYQRDGQAQKNLFWQMAWRAPGLKPNTIVLMNEELDSYADNSLSAPLNWIYDPNASADKIGYVLFYPTNRLGESLPALSYPPATRRPDRVEPDSGDVYAPAGTKVRVEVHADKAVRSGTLVQSDGTRLDLAPRDDSTLDAALTVTADSAYRVIVTDADGLQGGADSEYFIRVMSDHPPACASSGRRVTGR